jgi:D-alanine-D-alanine ligase
MGSTASRPLRIAVIQGGPSAEAAVSRRSAQGVCAALARAGHDVVRLELDARLPASLASATVDVVFPVVHGTVGEDGCLQGMLEVLGLAYVGSGVLASALAYDKVCAKGVFRAHGLPTAPDALVVRGEDPSRAAARVRETLGAAIVIKPNAQGSALGVTRLGRAASPADLVSAIGKALSLGDTALCERFVVGREVTCGVIDASTFGPARAFSPTEIVATAADFYDFTSRYGQGASAHTCPANLPEGVTDRVREVALAAHRALGCRDLSRADFVVGDGSDERAITLLEVNTLPGMTPTSLYPEAAEVAGITMQDLCDGLARSALARGSRPAWQAVPLPA